MNKYLEKLWKLISLGLENIKLTNTTTGTKIDDVIPTFDVPAWDKCTLASCWNGANAEQRMMNMLSPHMSAEKFKTYMDWMKARGCNTAHLFTSNQADGENARYCIYGAGWSWTINTSTVALMRDRIETLRKNGFAIVLWLFADDSKWNSIAKQNFPKYLSDLKTTGLLAQASIVVAGLELNEYFNQSDVQALITAIRSVYDGKVGTHETSERHQYAPLGDICFYQVNPGKSVDWIHTHARSVSFTVGKPLNFFEIERQPSREKCEAALTGGAYAVGNW